MSVFIGVYMFKVFNYEHNPFRVQYLVNKILILLIDKKKLKEYCL